MAIPKKKKETLKATEMWGSMFSEGDSLQEDGSDSIFKVQPVDIMEFISSKDYLGIGVFPGAEKPLSEIQENYLRNVSDFDNETTFYVLWWGKGSGKNFVAQVTFAYLVYKLLCMHDCHKYFGRPTKIKPITLINVAVNAQTARRNFFEPFSQLVLNAGPKAYRDFGFNPETGLLKNEVMFPNQIQVLSASSVAQEGYDILVALIDECDQAEFHGIDSVLQTFITSSNSRFFGKEKIINISYSRYHGSNGKIAQLYEENLDNSAAFLSRAKPWDVNPNPKYTEDYFVRKFKAKNPEEFKFIYECDTSSGNMEAWIKDQTRIRQAMKNKPWVLDLPMPPEKWLGNQMSEVEFLIDDRWVPVDPYNIPIKKRGKKDVKYIFVADPGAGTVESSQRTGGDAYGVCLAHREMVVREDGNSYPRTVIDFAFRFTGRMFPEKQIQFSAIEDLIVRLRKEYGYDIRVISFDGWNSVQMAQNLQKEFPDAIVYQRNIVELKHYNALREAIFAEAAPSEGTGRPLINGGIEMPYHPILYWELKELEENREKKKVDHKKTTSKDIADTLAMATYICTQAYPLTDMMIAAGHDTVPKTDDEKQKKLEELYSNVAGLGGFGKVRVF